MLSLSYTIYSPTKTTSFIQEGSTRLFAMLFVDLAIKVRIKKPIAINCMETVVFLISRFKYSEIVFLSRLNTSNVGVNAKSKKAAMTKIFVQSTVVQRETKIITSPNYVQFKLTWHFSTSSTTSGLSVYKKYSVVFQTTDKHYLPLHEGLHNSGRSSSQTFSFRVLGICRPQCVSISHNFLVQ